MLLEKLLPARRQTPRVKRSPGERLVDAIRELAGGHGALVSHVETPWASITFSGKRHTVRMLFDGVIPAESAEQMIAALPDHEFAIPGQLVVEALVGEVDHRLLPDERLEVVLDVLMLDDC